MSEMQKNSAKMLAIRSYEAAKFFVPVVFLWASTQRRLDGWAASLATAFFWGYAISRVHYVFADWWSTRYRVTAQGVQLTTGLLVKEDISINWAEIASVQVSRPWLHQALKCSMVRIGIGSQGKRQLILEAVPEAVAREFEDRFGQNQVSQRAEDTAAVGLENGPQSQPSVTTTQETDRPGEVIYAIGKVDYLLVSITYGQFALFVPACLGVYSQVSEWFRLPVPDTLGPLGDRPPLWLLAVALLATILAAISYGCAMAWLRYRSFKVYVHNGGLNITGGLISQESRQVLQSQIGGLKVEQNPLMRLMGYGKLSVVSRESGRKLSANVVFPAVKLQRLADGIDEFFPAYAGMMGHRRERRRVFDILVPVVSLGILFAAGAAVRATRPNAVYVTVGVLAVLQLVVANRIWAAAQIDSTKRSFHFRRGFLWVKQYEVPITSVHVVTQSQSPLGRLMGMANLSLLIYDARRVRLRLFWCREALASKVSRAVLAEQSQDGQGNLLAAATHEATPSTRAQIQATLPATSSGRVSPDSTAAMKQDEQQR